jgi:hypothetical protein
MFLPNYYNYNRGFDSPFNSPYLTHQQLLHAKENERRQRLQRQQELERRKRIQYRQALERQRREEEMEREMMLRREEEERARRMAKQREDNYAFPPGTIIRGRDGRLYRVVADPHPLNVKDNEPEEDDKSLSDTSVSSEEDHASSSSDSTMDEEGHITNQDVSTSTKTLNVSANEFVPKAFIQDKPIGGNNKKKTITLVVEDVPIDEDEELRDLHSVWRNRAPSPGQWMEPVESFNKQ